MHVKGVKETFQRAVSRKAVVMINPLPIKLHVQTTSGRWFVTFLVGLQFSSLSLIPRARRGCFSVCSYCTIVMGQLGAHIVQPSLLGMIICFGQAILYIRWVEALIE